MFKGEWVHFQQEKIPFGKFRSSIFGAISHHSHHSHHLSHLNRVLEIGDTVVTVMVIPLFSHVPTLGTGISEWEATYNSGSS
mmetsp:Transcript_128439/g.221920  ORF Transcript_128439/g.221920 Transcript_128439/m.221920 type:complete len:82 (+) Transcript_128439:633-878(+)